MGLIPKGNVKINEVKYLFIDGAYLDKVLSQVGKEFFDLNTIPIDYENMASSYYDKIFYYNALPGRKHKESKDSYETRITDKENYYNSLKLINNFHVYEGVIYGKGGRKRQKTVDTKIAVDMLIHTLRSNMNTAILLAGDMDFKPLLDALLTEGMITHLMYHKSSISNELLFSADKSIEIDLNTIYRWSTQDFKKSNPIPTISYLLSGSKRNINDLEKISDLKVNDKNATLYQNKSNNEFIFDFVHKKGSLGRVSFHDLKKLKLFLKLYHQITID